MEFAPGEATFDHFIDLGFFCEDLFGRRVEIVTPKVMPPPRSKLVQINLDCLAELGLALPHRLGKFRVLDPLQEPLVSLGRN